MHFDCKSMSAGSTTGTLSRCFVHVVMGSPDVAELLIWKCVREVNERRCRWSRRVDCVNAFVPRQGHTCSTLVTSFTQTSRHLMLLPRERVIAMDTWVQITPYVLYEYGLLSHKSLRSSHFSAIDTHRSVRLHGVDVYVSLKHFDFMSNVVSYLQTVYAGPVFAL